MITIGFLGGVHDGRDRVDEATLATIAANNTTFQHLRHIAAERGLDPEITDAFDSYLSAAKQKGTTMMASR